VCGLQLCWVKGDQQWYAAHRLEVVYLHAKYEKPILNDKKVTARTQSQGQISDFTVTNCHLGSWHFDTSSLMPKVIINCY
jgi:hypothetical protein